MTETGLIKFRAERSDIIAPASPDMSALNVYRTMLRERGFIGRDANGLGFGNISLRSEPDAGFFITVSGSAGRDEIGPADLVFVREWNIPQNLVRFTGDGTPSAETLTHAAVYEAALGSGAVLHIHNEEFFAALAASGMKTKASAEYGTPAMALQVGEFVEESEGLTKVFA